MPGETGPSTPTPNSADGSPETSLPARQLPDKSHDRLTPGLVENGLKSAVKHGEGLSGLGQEKPKDSKPEERPAVAAPKIGSDPVLRGEEARRESEAAQAQIKAEYAAKGEPPPTLRSYTREELEERARLSGFDPTTPSLGINRPRSPESTSEMPMVVPSLPEWRNQSQPRSVNELRQDRRGVLVTYGVRSLAELNALETRTPGTVSQVDMATATNAETQIDTIATETFGYVNLAEQMRNDVGRDIADPAYMAELGTLVKSYDGILDENQMQVLRYSILSARLQAAGQSTEGFSWEPAPPDILGAPEFPPEAKSTFEQAINLYNHYDTFNRNRLSAADQLRLDQQILPVLEREVARLVDEAERNEVFWYAAQDRGLKRLYNEVQVTRYQARSGSSTLEPEEQAVEVAATIPRVYREAFWDPRNPVLNALKDEYEGVVSYIMPRLAGTIVEDITAEEAPNPGSSVENRLFTQLRKDRERARERTLPEKMLNYNDWRERWELSWPETEGELRAATFAWLNKFRQHLPKEKEINSDPSKVSTDIQRWGENAVSSLETAATRLGIPDIVRRELRSLVETHVNTWGGVRLLEAGSIAFEAFTQLLEADAYGFIDHHSAKMVNNKRAFIVSDTLCKNNGEIYRAGDKDTIKPLAGDTEAWRDPRVTETVNHAFTHELYIREADFESARLGEGQIRVEVMQSGLSGKDVELEVQRRLEERRLKERRMGVKWNARYGWEEEDPIAELLLKDSRGLTEARTLATTDPNAGAEAEARVLARTGAFKKIKNRWDKEEKARSPVYSGRTLSQLSPDERKEEIRYRIRDKMDNEGNRILREEIDLLPMVGERDRELWKWVKEFNDDRQKDEKLTWFPTEWDLVRLSIDKPGKLRDRALDKKAEVEFPNGSKVVINEATAMVEKVKEVHIYSVNGVDTPFDYKGLTEGQIKKRVAALSGIDDRQRKVMLEDILFEREVRLAEAKQAFNIIRPYHTFVGYEARAGGMVVRELGSTGKVEMVNISVLRQEILKAKIDKEAAEIKVKVDWYAAGLGNNPGTLTKREIEDAIVAERGRLRGVADVEVRLVAYEKGLKINSSDFGRNSLGVVSLEQIEQAIITETRFQRRDTVFAATHALREIGIANDVPVWDYFFYGDQQLIAFVAPLCGYTDDDKGVLHQLLDKPRREIEAVESFLLAEYMDEEDGDDEVKKRGKILVVDDKPTSGHHHEQFARARVVNRAGNETWLGLIELPWNTSTSGGVKDPSLGIRVGRSGVSDMLLEFWSEDWQDFQGVVSMRDEAEARKQRILNISEWKDTKLYAQRLRKARAVQTALTGGNIEGKGATPGLAKEPLNGAWRMYNWFAKTPESGAQANIWLKAGIPSKPDKMPDDRKKLIAMVNQPDASLSWIEPSELNNQVAAAADIQKHLTLVMDARKDVVTNRAGDAPKNWHHDNELAFSAWAERVLERKPVYYDEGDIIEKGPLKGKIADGKETPEQIKEPYGGEILGSQHMEYSPEGRSLLAVLFYEAVLMGSTYHKLDSKDRKKLDKEAKKTRKALETKRSAIRTEVERELQSPAPTALKTMIAGRKAELNSQHATPEKLELELQRIKNHYIEMRLHKEFVGEWPAMFYRQYRDPEWLKKRYEKYFKS